MTDILNAEQNAQEIQAQTQATEEQAPILTVGVLIKDMAQYPQDAPVFACVNGIGMTIPIVGAFKVSTQDDLEIVALQIDMPGTLKALEHGQMILQTKNDGNTQ